MPLSSPRGEGARRQAGQDAQPLCVEEYYRSHIAPLVEPYETLRLEKWEQTKRRGVVGCGLCLAYLVAAIVILQASLGFSGTTLEWAGFGFAALVGLLFAWYRRPASQLRKAIKSEIFPKVFSFLGDDFDYRPKPPYRVKSLQESGLIPSHTSESSEDYIAGSHQGVKIELLETKLKRKQKKKTITVFKGMLVRLSMNKSFSGKTIVTEDKGAIGNWLGEAASTFSSLERVRLEDPLFEDRYQIYSDDQVEARYLLTPAFMERLMQLSTIANLRHAKDPIECSFYENKLLLKIPLTDNRFETAHISKPIDFRGDMNQLLEEMNEIFSIIDILKLNQRTGL
ncbi:MAG: DUF3137 domain-containing protein [Pseudomonadota bacterium]